MNPIQDAVTQTSPALSRSSSFDWLETGSVITSTPVSLRYDDLLTNSIVLPGFTGVSSLFCKIGSIVEESFPLPLDHTVSLR